MASTMTIRSVAVFCGLFAIGVVAGILHAAYHRYPTGS